MHNPLEYDNDESYSHDYVIYCMAQWTLIKGNIQVCQIKSQDLIKAEHLLYGIKEVRYLKDLAD